MNWKIIDDEFLNYLRKYDSRIPISDYGQNKMKPFFGALFSIDNLIYVTQISSPKPRHKNLKEQIDFRKMFKNDKLIAVVNLNYMFPVPEDCLSDIYYKDIDKYRKFSDDKQKSSYINLLKQEMKILNSMNIEYYAKLVYNEKYNSPNSSISQRSLDFKMLEKYASQFDKNKKLITV